MWIVVVGGLCVTEKYIFVIHSFMVADNDMRGKGLYHSCRPADQVHGLTLTQHMMQDLHWMMELGYHVLTMPSPGRLHIGVSSTFCHHLITPSYRMNTDMCRLCSLQVIISVFMPHFTPVTW